MDKFFIIRPASDYKITGLRDDSVQGEVLKKKFKTKEHYDNFYNFFFENPDFIGKFPDFNINLEYIKINDKARILDFMTFSPLVSCGKFLISDKVQDLIKNFNLPPYKLYPVKLFHKKTVFENYKLFYCPFLDFDKIDFQKSIFHEGLPMFNRGYIDVNNKEEYLNHTGLKSVEKIVLNSNCNKDYDLIRVRIAAFYFISERLKEMIELANLTGLNIIEAKNPSISFNKNK